MAKSDKSNDISVIKFIITLSVFIELADIT